MTGLPKMKWVGATILLFCSYFGRAPRAPLLGCGAASCHSRGIYIYLSYGGHLPLRRAFLAPNRARAPDKNGAACAGSDSNSGYMYYSMHLGSIACSLAPIWYAYHHDSMHACARPPRASAVLQLCVLPN